MFEPNFIILAITVPEKSVTEISCERKWRERKMDKKRNDKQEEADAFFQNTTNHIQRLHKISNTFTGEIS